MNEVAKEWLARAREDLETVERLLEEEGLTNIADLSQICPTGRDAWSRVAEAKTGTQERRELSAVSPEFPHKELELGSISI